MAKKQKNVSTRTTVDDINEQLTSIEQRVENNKKIITWSIVGIVVVALAVLAVIYGYIIPQRENAQKEISNADAELLINQNDSLALPIYQKVAKEYSGATANRANLQAAEILYEQGKYEEALKYLNDYSAEDELVGAAAQSLTGDCYVQLKKLDEAVKCFDKAIATSGANDLYTPIFMLKKANVLNAQNKAKEALAVYEAILNDYPTFDETFGAGIEKYIARAKAQAGE